MRYYTRAELLQLLEVEETFLWSLEQEEIIWLDAPEAQGYSERMLERVRVSQNLVHELDVNLAGAAVILSLREQLTDLQARLAELASRVAQRRSS
jgi:hypothetical protein